MSTTPAESLIAKSNPSPKKWTASRILFGVVAVSSVLVGIASYRYLIGVAVLENIAANTYYNPTLPIHAASAATALIAGPIQFVASARRRYPRAHRIVGRLYGVSCIIGGVSGIVLAAGASTGPIASAGFAALGTLWLICTVQAWQLAFNRRIAEHRRWMIRSFALTFAAVTLRLYIPIFLNMGIKFDPAYRAISWLCWVPNILLAEAYLAKTQTKVAPNIQLVTQSPTLPSDSTDKQQASATSIE